MKDLLKKIENVYEDILVAQETVASQGKVVADDKKAVASKKAMLDARETSINARERIVANLESASELSKKSKETQASIVKCIDKNEELKDSVSKKIAENKKLLEEIRVEREINSGKIRVLKEKEASIDKKVESLKGGLLAKLAKELK